MSQTSPRKRVHCARRRASVIVLCVSPILCILLSAQASAERLPVKTYTTADGLSRDHINRIFQDSRGFLWFCTSEGLSRFDGYRFINYGAEQGLIGRQVNDFLETRAGDYWAATDKGLCHFVPDAMPQPGPGRAGTAAGKFIVYYPGEDAAARSIKEIYEDHSGAIWCCTQGGLYRLHQIDGEPVFSLVNFIRPARTVGSRLAVEAVVEDRRGSLWVIAQSGLYRQKPDGTVELYTAEQGLPEGFSRELLADHEGRIWVGSKTGLYQLVPDPKPNCSIVARQYTAKDGLATSEVTCLCESSDGTLWAGTVGGLSALGRAQNKPDAKLQTYTEANGLSRSTIASVFQDRAGELCVVTDDTISKFDGRRLTAIRVTLPAGIPNWGWGWYQIMFQDSAGEWWFNTFLGLVRYPKTTSVQQLTQSRPRAIYKERDGLPSAIIFRLFEDSRHDIWISTLGKPKAVLTRWNRATSTFHTYQPSDGIPESAPTAFCEDGTGDLWIGFYDGGLLRYRDGRFEPYTSSDGVPPGMIRGLYLDHAKRLWIATGEGGVARIDNPAAERPGFVNYSTADGLSSNQATCVTEDNWGMIYIGTGRGLDKLDPATGHIRHYSITNGLANSFVNVSYRHPDGSLWFGTLQGLSRLTPEPDLPAVPPRILITGFRPGGISQAISEVGATDVSGLEAGAGQNNVEIEYSGLSFAAGESLQYQYRLEGSSADWSAPSDQRAVAYASLPSGSYRFLVRAISSRGTLSQRPAIASFTIFPPIWQMWWFRLLAFALVAAPIAALVTYRFQRAKVVREAEGALRRSREERLAELERVRTRIATDLHDDIGSSLSQIYLLSEVVRQRASQFDSQVTGPLEMICAASHDVVNSMSDIVWSINPQKDHLSDLIQRMRRFASDTLSASEVALRFTAPDDGADIRLGADVRREVFLIFKESVNNVVRHSCASEAEIDFVLTSDSLSLMVKDNGKGFDPSNDENGHGFASMRERARR